jgi:hypothetical protein
MAATAARTQWPQMLREFSRRNAGRHTRLEIDDAELGAQWGELELRFRGAACEPRFRRVELMLADGGPTSHLTHSIEGVTDVDVLRDAGGLDQVLRIGYLGGQTLLRLAAV